MKLKKCYLFPVLLLLNFFINYCLADTKINPYIDATNWPLYDFVKAAKQTKVKQYSLGFIVSQSGQCKASWGGFAAYKIGDFRQSDIARLRKLGGDVTISFGGQAGLPLAEACKSPQDLLAQYENVINAYHLKSVDFDIEGTAVADPASIKNRSIALHLLQAKYPTLKISYTLPVLPTGLDWNGLNTLSCALNPKASNTCKTCPDCAIKLSRVNIMAMDYGDNAAPNPQGKMGDYAIQSAKSLYQQLQSLLPNKNSHQIWSMVGVIPMIGQNDTSDEIFDLNDAKVLSIFAKEKKMGMLSFWDANRDRPCGKFLASVKNNCSGIDQSEYGFMKLFLTNVSQKNKH